MKINKRYKIIASALIITVFGLILSSADIRESILKFLNIYETNKVLSSTGYEVTELGSLQNTITEGKKEVEEAIKNNDVEKCKEVFNNIVNEIKETSKDIEKEFNEAEEVVKKVDYKDAQDRLNEVENNHEKIVNKIKVISGVIESNDINKYSELLADKELFGEEEAEAVLGESLPNSNVTEEAEYKDISEVNRTSISEYPKDLEKIEENEYLKETIETTFSNVIKEKAKEIGNKPLDIYKFVRNNISYSPYAGSRKGATGTLKEYSGNDYDQSSLLISLFKYNKIPARYVRGTVELSAKKAMEWTGTDSIEAAVKVLASCGNKTVAITSSGSIVAVQVEHVWVEAYCSLNEYRGNGVDTSKKEWIPFDPSFKSCEEVEAMDKINNTIFSDEDIDNFIEETAGFNYVNQSDIEGLINSVNNKTNQFSEDDFKNKTAFEIFGGYKIIEEDLKVLPLSILNKLIKIESRFSEIEDKNRDYVSIDLSDSNGLYGNLSYRKSAVELYGKKITLSWVPNSEKDEEIIKKYKDIYNTPAYLVEVKPVLKLDGDVVAEGNAISFGASESLETTIERVGLPNDKINNILTAGGFYVIGLDYGRIAQEELIEIQDNLKKVKDQINTYGSYSDEVLGEVLDGIVKDYFSQVDGNKELISRKYNVRDTRMLSFGMSGTSLSKSSLFGQTVDVKLASLYIDIDNDASSPVSLNNDKDELFMYTTHSGVMASSLENKVFEDAFGIESVSTIKIISLSVNRNIPIHVIDSTNINEVLPQLKVSNNVKNEVVNAVNSGKVVTIPESEMDYYDWHGTGYIVQDPISGSAGYMISGGHSGGSVATDLSQLDWGEVLSYFVAGLIEGIVSGIAFAAIGIVGSFFFPWFSILMYSIAIIFLTILLIEIIDMIFDYLSGDMCLQDYYNKLGYIIGSLIGAFIGGKITEGALKGKIEASLRKMVNEKYNLSEEVSSKLYENSGNKNYNKNAKAANDLKKNGLTDKQICDSLDKVPSDKFGEYSDAVNNYKNETQSDSVPDSKLKSMQEAASEGKSVEDIVNAAKIESDLLDSNGKFKDTTLEQKYQDYCNGKEKKGKTPRDRKDWKEASDKWSELSKQGKDFADENFANLKENYSNAEKEITIETNNNTKIRVDGIAKDANGNIIIEEYKSSDSAPFTKNQKVGFPELFKLGGKIVGEGKGIFKGGVEIPKGTKVKVIRPNGSYYYEVN